MAALAWVKDDNKEPYNLVTSARVAYELYQRVSSSSDIDVYQVSLSSNRACKSRMRKRGWGHLGAGSPYSPC